MAEDESSALVERVADELQAALGVRLEILADRFHDTVSGRLEVAADEFEASLWVRRYGGHVDRLRRLSRASEKLVYLFLVNSEPQSFSTLQRSLSLSSSSHAFASIASLPRTRWPAGCPSWPWPPAGPSPSPSRSTS